ncbi:glycosyl transferase family 2 [Isoptericola jiangsuensis]|uniref:Glucosyl-3-phosphoglycerate synthase n=2 Tax=Isoptericola jiangsuensis TaxID=548579 RepID=A0A2A9F297_9MICO|nr:glycosyl transferase family 2 [Isoptericola jiangsuensis]
MNAHQGAARTGEDTTVEAAGPTARRNGMPKALTPRPPTGRDGRSTQRVAVVIPAKDESERIAATVRSARAIPHVDLVLVVDDGSDDDTQHVAREAGAVVVRHSHNRGKAAAMETGAAVVAMRDADGRAPRLLLFIDGDLGDTAVNTAPLVGPVREGLADVAIALLPAQKGAGGRGIVVGASRRAIHNLTGWSPTQPLSGMRCLTREAFEAATPLARGWGVETGMTIDLLRAGYTAVEVPCDLRHRPSSNDLKGQIHRASQYRDVLFAVNARRVRRAVSAVGRVTNRTE